MPKLGLIKHSLPLIDPARPAATWQLAPEGLCRCALLAAHLAPYLPAALVSSVEPKARATATALAKHLSLTATTADGLEEHHRATAPFLSDAEFEQAVRNLFVRPAERVFGEESADEAADRFGQAIDRLIVQYPNQNLLVVAHGTVISLFLSRRAGVEPFKLWCGLGLPSMLLLDQATMQIELQMLQIGEDL